MKTKDIVVGLGEIGSPIMQLLSKNSLVVGYDVDKSKMDVGKFQKYAKLETSFMHVCVPFSNNFVKIVIGLYNKFRPKCIVIHSTIKPLTTKKIQQKLPIPVIYSATRGVHRRMLFDLKRYTKFYGIEPDAPNEKWASQKFSQIMKNAGVKTQKMSNPVTLELAKIVCDTSYYGWLITYSQLSNMIAMKHNVKYDEMWTFADEIHKFLQNRPKMFPGFIGGHCVIQNLPLVDNEILNMIDKINSKYAKILKSNQ